MTVQADGATGHILDRDGRLDRAQRGCRVRTLTPDDVRDIVAAERAIKRVTGREARGAEFRIRWIQYGARAARTATVGTSVDGMIGQDGSTVIITDARRERAQWGRGDEARTVPHCVIITHDQSVRPGRHMEILGIGGRWIWAAGYAEGLKTTMPWAIRDAMPAVGMSGSAWFALARDAADMLRDGRDCAVINPWAVLTVGETRGVWTVDRDGTRPTWVTPRRPRCPARSRRRPSCGARRGRTDP